MGTHQVWSGDAFPFGKRPGPWASLEEREIFLSQGETKNSMDFTSGNSILLEVNWLIYYLGPCEVERLMRGVFFETVLAQPWEWLRILPEKVLLWLQPSLQMGEYPNLTLPSEHSLTFSGDWMLGFQRAFGRWDHYTGQWVWRPGIEIFTSLWAPLNALRFLVFPALVWALFTGVGSTRRLRSCCCYTFSCSLLSMHPSHASTPSSIRWGRCWWEVCWWRCGIGCGRRDRRS